MSPLHILFKLFKFKLIHNYILNKHVGPLYPWIWHPQICPTMNAKPPDFPPPPDTLHYPWFAESMRDLGIEPPWIKRLHLFTINFKNAKQIGFS